jgi:hypothetical protein
VDTAKDLAYRKAHGYRPYDPRCKFGFGQVQNGRCEWFQPIYLLPIANQCPSIYRFTKDACQWNGDKSKDIFTDKVSLAFLQSNLGNGWRNSVQFVNNSNARSPVRCIQGRMNTTDFGEPLKVTIMNDMRDKYTYEVCSLQNGKSKYFEKLSGQGDSVETDPYVTENFQIRYWSDAGRCQGGIISRIFGFSRSTSQVTLSQLLRSCDPTV